MSNKSTERILVTVVSEDPKEFEAVHAALKLAGMNNSRVISSRIIAGVVSPGQRRALESVPGVEAVEPDEEMHAL